MTFNPYRDNTQYVPPGVVDILLTYNCNNACPYCFVRDRGTDMPMKPEILDRTIDWITENARDNVNVVFFGGEPTLEPLLMERAVERARDWEKKINLKFDFTMTTNTQNIDIEFARLLNIWKVHYMVSVDGFGERHDLSRPSKISDTPFDDLKNKMPFLKKYQNRIPARMTTTPATVDWLNEDLKKLYQMGFNSFIVSPVTGSEWPENKLNKYVSEMVEFALEREIVDGQPQPRVSPVDDPPKGFHTWGCGAARGRYSIDPRGNIFACARFAELDAENGLAIGDIYHGIDFNGNFLKFQDQTYESRPECFFCDERELCLGGCPANNYRKTGEVIKPSPEECRLSKAVLEIFRQVKKGSDKHYKFGSIEV